MGRSISDNSLPYHPVPSQDAHLAVGKGTKRTRCETSEALALCFSFACSVIGLLCCFHPVTAAHLGQSYQLIVVGLTLSLMDLCTSKLATIVFLQLETKWSSALQNYDAIIKKSALSSLLNWNRGDQRWTLLLSATVVFPLLLSAAYKTFTGGKVEIQINGDGVLYGLTGPVGFGNFTSGSALMVNATFPIVSSLPNKIPTQSYAYGFNMLLLDEENISVAMLDGPSPSYVESIKKSLKPGETRKISANVNGLAWNLDPGVEDKRTNDTWWKGFFGNSDDEKPQTIILYKEHQLLASLWPMGQVDRFFLYIETRRNGAREVSNQDFQESALGFVSRRRKCKGTWRITQGAVDLIEGECGEEITEKYPEHCTTLHLNDAKFIISDFIDGHDTTDLDSETQIRFTAVVSALLWSRLVAYCGVDSPLRDVTSQELSQVEYTQNDLSWTTVRVLRRSRLLAAVLLAQPVVGFALLLLRVIWSAAPVSGNFGLISVLAGHKTTHEDILVGAGLSGEAKQRVELSFEEDLKNYGRGTKRLRFRVTTAAGTSTKAQSLTNTRLKPNTTYL